MVINLEIYIGQFKNDLMNSPYVDGVKNVTASKYNYNECLSQILDKHTPAKQIEVTIKGRGVNLNMIGMLLTLRA